MNYYRNEITILRAFAVVSVILFHAKVPYFEGGYLGVDIFFVISGFLIYGNIQKQVQQNKFTFYNFYIRRLRRLFPALIFVLIITSFAAFAILLPYDLKNYGQSLFATLISANNILLLLTSGYWSIVADFKPLYHTWSLAVEEQFYLIGPILFLYTNRKINDLRKRIGVYIVLFICSLILFVRSDNREFSFLMPHTRAWELLAGVISYYFFSVTKTYFSRFVFLLPTLGCILILVSLVTGRGMYILPTVFAVFGASLILVSHISNSFWVANLNKIFFRPFIFVGLISYSLYLWHQPVLAYVRYVSIGDLSVVSLLISFIFIFALAFVTWKFIEEKFRVYLLETNKTFINSVLALSVILAGTGLILNFTYGMRKFSIYDYGDNPQTYVDGVKDLSETILQKGSFDKNVIVLGNSFARDFINVLKYYRPIYDFNIKYYQGDCELLVRSDFRDDLLLSKFVFYSENWAQDIFDISEIKKIIDCQKKLSELSTNSKIFVVGVKNFGLNNGFVKINSITSNFFVAPKKSVQEFNSNAADVIPGYIDIISKLKNVKNMVPIFDEEGNLLTYDTNHLTSAGAKYLSKVISSDLNFAFGVDNENTN